jgi:hypothetical protein
MKKSVYLFSVLLCLSAVAACSDWGEEPELNILELESADVSFNAFGGTGNIVVKSAGGVTAACDDSWCTLAVSENKVTVTVPANGELSERSTVVTVISGAKKVQVPVTQSGVQIELDRSLITLPGEASDTSLAVNAPIPLTATSSATWLVPSISGATLAFHAEANPDFIVREATVSVTAGSFTTSVVVAQQPRKAPFDAYAGTWTFSHGINPNLGTRYDKTAVIESEQYNAKLRVTLQAGTVTSSTFTFFMDYDPETGKVDLPVQKVFENGANSVILSGYDGFFVNYGVGTGGMTGTLVGHATDPALTFADNGKDDGGMMDTYIGFVLWQITTVGGVSVEEYTGFGEPETSRYVNISMIKQ